MLLEAFGAGIGNFPNLGLISRSAFFHPRLIKRCLEGINRYLSWRYRHRGLLETECHKLGTEEVEMKESFGEEEG